MVIQFSEMGNRPGQINLEKKVNSFSFEHVKWQISVGHPSNDAQ